jgi:hypothetical protein
MRSEMRVKFREEKRNKNEEIKLKMKLINDFILFGKICSGLYAKHARFI